MINGKFLSSHTFDAFFQIYNLTEEDLRTLFVKGYSILQTEWHVFFDEEELRPFLKKQYVS